MAKGKVLQAVVDVAGSVDPSLGKAMDQATKGLEGINFKALAVAGAAGGIAVATGKAVLEAGKYLKDLGEQFDGAADAIRIGTGATGEALDSLLDDFDAVYSGVPTDMDSAAKAVADFNTRLDLTGPTLQEISKQAIQVSDMLGDDLNSVIEESSQAIKQWDIDADDMGDAMDYVFKASQSTGMGFTDLMSRMQQYGPQLQEMGYSFEEATALMGQLDKAGVNVDETLAAMKKSVGTLAKEGIGAADGMAMYYEQILNAGDAAEAAAIANEVFGARAGSTMAAAIRDGSLAVDDLTASLMANDETIAGAAEDTYDFAERLQLMKQNLEVALKPIANTVFDGLNKFMPVLQKLLEKIIPVIGQAVDAAMPFVEDFLMGAADILETLMPMISEFASLLLPILSDLIGSLLPPLLNLAQQLLPPLMQIVQAILPPIAQILTSILPIIVQIANIVLPVIVGLITSLLPVITPLLDVLVMILRDVIQPILPPIMQLVQALLPVMMSLLEAIAPALFPILNALGPIAEILSVIIGLIAKLVGWIADGVGWVVEKVLGTGGNVEIPAGYATGGFTDGLSIAGEDPRYPTEAVISFNPAFRAQNLAYWAQAGRMLGMQMDTTPNLMGGGGSSVVIDMGGVSFAPNILAQNGMDTAGFMKEIRKYAPEFVDFMMEQITERLEGAYEPIY